MPSTIPSASEPIVPPRTSSKRGLQQSESLEEQERGINDSIRIVKKRLRPQASFNAQFWTQAADIENLMIARSEVQRKISLGKFDGPEAAWQATEAAKTIFQDIQAHTVQRRICSQRSEKLVEKGKRSLRASFIKLFTTSKMGMGIKETGAGKRDGKMQSQFREEIINAYGSQEREGDTLWCPILGRWVESQEMRAGHIFAYVHGQDTMDAIFGPTNPPELFSPRNGLILSRWIEEFFDSGKLVLVPDLADKPGVIDIRCWVAREPREYKIRILDPTWSKLDKLVSTYFSVTWRDLHNKRVEFRTEFRPRARYLYFHYCIQVLRHVWQQSPEAAILTLKDEKGKPYWATPGRYINKKMLKAFVEELGHDAEDLLKGASCDTTGDENLILDIAAKQVAATTTKMEAGYEGDDEKDEKF